MDDRRRTIDDGRSTMDDPAHRPIEYYRLSTIDHRPLTIDHRPLTIALVLAAAAGLAAQTSDRLRTESQARRASERLVALQREAEALAAQERTLLTELRRLELERDLKTEELRQIDADTRQVARELGNAGNQIDALEAQADAERPLLEARIVELYKLGSPGYIRLLFNVADLKEFGRAYRLVSALAALDRQRAAEHQQHLRQLRSAHAALKERSAEMTKLQRQAQAARVATERAAQARLDLIAQIDARRDLTAELANELQSAQQRLQETLGAINSGLPRAASDASALPIRPFRGDLAWPVAGRVMTQFRRQGPRVTTVAGQNGVQIATDEDAQIRAVHDGTVAFAGPFAGYGNLLIVDHGAQTYSLYGQLGSFQASTGTKLERGHIIGTAGRVLAGIPGIYFEMRVDGKPVDPLEWLKKRP
jgi:septal ring factor EnvC (AmiA/AmiB activator)